MKSSLTGRYLSGTEAIPVPTTRRQVGDQKLQIIGAAHHNLKQVTVDIPLGCFVAVTGVSGSGKSSLINDVLWASLARRLHRAQTNPGLHESITGIEYIDKVINVDQQPIGNTPASNPATYTGIFDLVRELYAQLPDAKFGDSPPGGSVSIDLAVVARRARGAASNESKCTSSPTSGSRAMSATANGTLPRRWPSPSRESRLPTCLN